MRDPNRIDPILARLRAAWIASPDLRLGQLLAGSLAIGGAEDRFNRMFQAECDEFGAVNAPIEWPPVDRPAPTPTHAPGLDFDAVERAERAMTPGPWHGSGCSFGHGIVQRTGNGFAHGFQDDAPCSFDVGAANAAGIVALRNAAPALIAEVRALRAEVAERRETASRQLAAIGRVHDRISAKLAEAKRLADDALLIAEHEPTCAIGPDGQDADCNCRRAAIAAALEAL